VRRKTFLATGGQGLIVRRRTLLGAGGQGLMPERRARVGLTGRWVAAALAVAIAASACAGSTTAESQATPQSAVPETVAAPATSTTAAPRTTTTEAFTPAIEAPPPIPIRDEPGWELVWQDEFDGDEIDLSNWTYDIGGWGWGNGEAQYYTSRPRNARVSNGLLMIEAHQEKYENSYYTSARMLTQGLREFQYGRMEARIKVPAGAGLWPAFWMLGSDFIHRAEDEAHRWPFVGEIDIMEYVGREPDLILGTVHGPGYAGALGLSKWFRQDYLTADEFHTYAIEWDYDGIRWFYDDQMYYDLARTGVGNREWVFDGDFFLILNLAVGGLFPGPVALDLEFPVQMYVDYVRVYQRDSGAGA